MRVSLVTIAVVMLCAHDVYANVQPQKDFDLQRFAGKWYRVGLAYDSPGFVLYRHKLKISMGILTPMANGSANMTMWTQRSSGCRCKNYIYEKTDVSGQFNYFSIRHNRMKDITVVETNYNEYALVLKHKKMNREFTQVALYGRSQRLRPQLLEKFREFALALGFPKESILTPLAAAEDCPPAEQ
ncbi:prostaglandin D2 synthase a isoform X1 [Megalops cyprinoides]|uniref:prostaglandin D2 synthase a isoform X1 n=1 Tax=Megalops cyprinoides TaxID=118141 RepID=UPI001864FEAF|nr:prostaglandin D2 synthase a isoform X1 [Megalops cyprinoides]XP_036385424.1 prostaglandin D2 synthase a isoform X1 [Megalops cyprinoides]